MPQADMVRPEATRAGMVWYEHILNSTLKLVQESISKKNQFILCTSLLGKPNTHKETTTRTKHY